MRFVLVHGGFHGAWCWSRTLPELERLGHEGFDITRAADAAPERVAHLVYLAAAFPLEGRSQAEAITRQEVAVSQTDAIDDATGMVRYLRVEDDGRLVFADFQGAWDLFYHDCDEATARWAFERLTPEGGPDAAACVSVPRFWEAELPRSFIRCRQDRAQPPWLAERVAKRLGVEPLGIDASHSPFLSRPGELAELRVHATTTVPVGPLRRD